jgi:methyl-accepting chemotaxis protein
MDEVTQQNAALVEEATASARSLEEQAGTLAHSVSRFNLGSNSVAAPVPQVVADAKAERPAPRRPQAKPAVERRRPAVNGNGNGAAKPADPQWTEF